MALDVIPRQKTKSAGGKISFPAHWFGKSAVNTDQEALEISRQILDRITGGKPLDNLNVRFWNGDFWQAPSQKPATLVLKRPSALREMLEGGTEVSLGEAYLREAFDVEGDIEAAFEMADLLAEQTQGWTKLLSLASLLHQLPEGDGLEVFKERKADLNGSKNSPERDRKAIRFHYDISNAFYSLWLDPRMVYSCAYFENAETDLETAQLRKLDLICRKLNLQAGERLLEIGCGWGGLLIHAALHYGVNAVGITLSQSQFVWTQELIERHGLKDQVTVKLVDYRELDDPAGYDKVASVGMVEHVGRQNLRSYFEQAWTLLKPSGLFLNHGIGIGPVTLPNKGEGFIQRYVFPDSDLIHIGQMLEIAEAGKWEIRDVDSLRKHYAWTLRHWVRRLESRHTDALREVDEATYRTWRLYMAGSAHGFASGYLSVYQTLLAKLDRGGDSLAPLTRDKWYS
jgi:cyclopropane-fatty-acyl-phospholipid synthase